VGAFAGVFGMAYFVYGKRTQKFTWMIVGVLLCVYSYFLDDLLLLLVVGAVLMAVPFFIHE
jgi:hypothetical protein